MMARTKAVAIFLGPAGMGLVGLYTTTIAFVSTFSAMGIGSSAVRQVAEADGLGDEARLTRTIKALRRICWVTGFLGWALTAIFAWPLSLWIFGSGERAWAIAILGVTILLTDISGGQSALLQGKRRIGDLARLNLLSAIISSIVSVSIYAWLRERGIIPVMILSAMISLLSTWWFARRIQIADTHLTWRETWPEGKRMLRLGLAFMWSAVLFSAVSLATRSLIVRMFGLEANGIYQSAWAISGMFAGFIIGAMGTDFYPRLTAAAHDDKLVNRLVNEQTEIGILLALPGLLGTLAFAPWLMQIFYTVKFLPGAELLPWFVLGIFGKVISWPMAFIMLAKGESRWFAGSETVINLLHLGLIVLSIHFLGLKGIAVSFAVTYGTYALGTLFIGRHLTGFSWAPGALRLLLTSAAMVFAGFAAREWAPGISSPIIGGLLVLASSLFSVRGIALRLGPSHKIVALACKLPGIRRVCRL